MLNIGKKIAELRKEKNWSQTDLAKAVDVSRDIIGKYERGEHSPSIEITTKLADALESYFAASEQLPTHFWFASNKESVGGMLIQTMTMFIVPVLYSMWQERNVKRNGKATL